MEGLTAKLIIAGIVATLFIGVYGVFAAENNDDTRPATDESDFQAGQSLPTEADEEPPPPAFDDLLTPDRQDRMDRQFDPGDEPPFSDRSGTRRRGPGGHKGQRERGPGSEFRGDFLNAEEIEELMDFAQEHFPRVYDRLKRARTYDQRSFQHMLPRAGMPLLHLLRLKREDPPLAELLIEEHKIQMTIFELQKEYRAASSNEQRDTILAKLREPMEKRFNLMQKRLEYEIEKLRQRLESQAQRLAEREKNKDKLIEAELLRLKYMMDDDEDIEPRPDLPEALAPHP